MLPILEGDSGFTQGVEQLPVQALPTKTTVETLHIPPAVAGPGTAGLDVDRLDSILFQPVPDHVGDKLRTIA